MSLELRVAVCEYSKLTILQRKFPDGWLCLHRDTREEELEDIYNFAKTQEEVPCTSTL